MNHKHAHGMLVSYWAKDPKVTKLRLSYNFAVSCLGVFGLARLRFKSHCAKHQNERL